MKAHRKSLQQNARHTGMLAPIWRWIPRPGAASAQLEVHVTQRGMLEADSGSESEVQGWWLADSSWALAGDLRAAGGTGVSSRGWGANPQLAG